ncbi:unnamed protein product, partial [Prorocentrum cordatum]
AVTAVCGERGAPPWPAGQMGGPAAILHAGGEVLEVHPLRLGQKLILEFLRGAFRGAHEAFVVERDQPVFVAQQFIGDCKSTDEEASEPVEEPTKAFSDQVARVLDPSMDALSSEHVGVAVHLPMGDVVVQTVCEELPAVPLFPVLGKRGLAEDDRDVEDLPEDAVKLEAVKVEAKTVEVAMRRHVDRIQVLNASAGETEKIGRGPKETEKIVKVPMAEYVENIVHVPTGVAQEAEQGVSRSCTASSAGASAAGASESAAAGSEQGEPVHEYEKEVMNEPDDATKVASLSGGGGPSARGPRGWGAAVETNQLARARAAAAAARRRAQRRLEHDELEGAAVFGTAALAAPRVATPQREAMAEAEVPTGLAEDESQRGRRGLCDKIAQACDPFEPGPEEHEAALGRVLEGLGLAVDDFRSEPAAPAGKKRKHRGERRGQMNWG